MKFYKNIHFLATSLDESKEIKKIINIDNVFVASNIPSIQKSVNYDTKKNGKLKIVFLSRITKKKNLDFALKTLATCESHIEFDIYGTLEEKEYWAECQEIIERFPHNIITNYKGELPNEVVIETLSKYDLFYLPTRSENYGHVISESLQASVPVLISNTTPWNNLEDEEMGWVYSLNSEEKFSDKIDDLAKMTTEHHNTIKGHIYKNFDVQPIANRESDRYVKYLNSIINN